VLHGPENWSLAENKFNVLRRLFGLKKVVVTE
jgi:hypothetical protein